MFPEDRTILHVTPKITMQERPSTHRVPTCALAVPIGMKGQTCPCCLVFALESAHAARQRALRGACETPCPPRCWRGSWFSRSSPGRLPRTSIGKPGKGRGALPGLLGAASLLQQQRGTKADLRSASFALSDLIFLVFLIYIYFKSVTKFSLLSSWVT